LQPQKHSVSKLIVVFDELIGEPVDNELELIFIYEGNWLHKKIAAGKYINLSPIYF
jgi:hypothetical protein